MEGFANLILGIFLGYMAWYFIARNASKSLDGLAAVAGVIFGALAIQFLSPGDNRWLYPIGLAVGWITWITIRVLGGEDYAIAVITEAPPVPPAAAAPAPATPSQTLAKVILVVIAFVVLAFGLFSLIDTYIAR
jgi:hypothetical protein